MRKLIDNKLYDTETAKEICSSTTSTEVNHTAIKFYKTENGNFFKHTYKVHVRGNVQTNEIEASSVKDAQTFYAENGDISKWKDIFGEEVEKA